MGNVGIGIETTTIKEKQEGTSLLVYPNPTSGVVNIETGSGAEPTVSVYSQSGGLQLVQTGNQVDLSPLPQGVYIFRVGNESVRVVKK